MLYPSKRSAFTLLFTLLIAVFPFLVTISGAFENSRNNIVTNIYVLIFLSLSLLFVFLKGKTSEWTLHYSLVLLLILILVVVRSSFEGVFAYKDIYLIFRSWFFLLILILVLSKLFNIIDRRRFVRNIFIIYWIYISISILLALVFDIGLETYPNFNSGHKFWFPATNELSFVYFSLFSFLYIQAMNWRYKACLLGVTSTTFLIVGTKIFIVLMFVLIVYELAICVKRRLGFTIFLFLVASLFLLALASFFWIDNILIWIASILTRFSEGGATLETKIKAVGLFSAMVGERDFLIKIALNYISDNFSSTDYFFGKGLHIYMTQYGIYRGVNEPSLAENDFVDIFCSYGLIGLMASLLFIFKAFNVKILFSKMKSQKLDYAISFQGIIVLLSASLSGHILMSTFPLLILGLVISLRLN